MKTKLLYLLFILFGTSITAQTFFRGTIVDEATLQPIKSAKIGITHQGLGVLSDVNGKFNYRKYNQVLDKHSELIVSAPGYKNLVLDIEKLRVIYDQPVKLALSKGTEKKEVRDIVINVFWDASEGMVGRDEEKELAYLENYLQKYDKVAVNFAVFSHKILFWIRDDIVEGDISRFRESIKNIGYNGPSDFSLVQMDGASKVLLFSNGNNALGILNTQQDTPVTCISTVDKYRDEDYLRAVALYTSGDYILLDRETVSMPKKQKQEKFVKGLVQSDGKPIQGAKIVVKGSFDEYESDANGNFKTQASNDDILVVSYLGMFSREVLVSDTQLVVDLVPKNNVLDEVVLTGNKKEINVSGKKIKGNIYPSIPGGYTSLGDFYITSEDITPNGLTLERVIRDKFKGVILSHTPGGELLTVKGKNPQYVVNGFLLNPDEPLPFYISDTEIESIVLKDSPNLTSRYSITPISGLAIVITTKGGAGTNQQMGKDLLTKNNDYSEIIDLASQVIVSDNSTSLTGTVTSLGKPLQGVVITNKSSYNEVKSDANGSFKIGADEGDQVFFGYLNMFPKMIRVNNTNDTLKIELMPRNDVLDEITVKGNSGLTSKGIGQLWALKNTELTSGNITSIPKEAVEKYPNLGDALNGKVSGISAGWNSLRGIVIEGRNGAMPIAIDYMLFEPDQYVDVDPSIVYRVDIIKSTGVSTPFGPTTTQGMTLITTINNPDFITSRRARSPLLKNNIYNEESLEILPSSNYVNLPTKNLIMRGVVRSEGNPLQGASVNVKGTFDEVYTNDKGAFLIDASIGDILVVNSLGMFPKEVLIEERMSIYTIDLAPRNNALDEIVVRGSGRVDNTISTGFGQENEDKIGYAVAEIKEETFNTGATSLRDLITGQFSGVTVKYNAYEGTSYRMRSTGSINDDIPPIWIVNGVPYQNEPAFLDVQQIASISALKGLKAVNQYGTIARGGAFLITTKNYVQKDSDSSKPHSGLISGNNYQEETVTIDTEQDDPIYITRLRETPNSSDQFIAYQKMARTKELSLEFYSDVIRYFQKTHPKNADRVRADLAYIARNNSKALRTLAYLYEEANDHNKMLQVYERILSIAPQESQSYRDLANALVINKKYNKALELYRNMLGERIRGVGFTGIEPVLKTELSRLSQLFKDKIEYERLPSEWLRTDFKRDVRMVIEWSDRGVPFEFQFVNPDKKFFKWMHTLEDNRERLQQERKEGFQMEEFIIDDAPEGEWIINIQYLGEQGDYVLPPFLKYTIYRNYGTSSETKQMRVIKLFKQSEKVTLGKITI